MVALGPATTFSVPPSVALILTVDSNSSARVRRWSVVGWAFTAVTSWASVTVSTASAYTCCGVLLPFKSCKVVLISISTFAMTKTPHPYGWLKNDVVIVQQNLRRRINPDLEGWGNRGWVMGGEQST